MLSYYEHVYYATVATVLRSITRLAVRLSLCPSVCLSVCPVPACSSKTKKRRKIKIGTNVPQDMSKCNAYFQFERSKFKVMEVKTSKYGVIFTLGMQRRWIKRDRRRLHTRPTPLLGLLYCRRLRV